MKMRGSEPPPSWTRAISGLAERPGIVLVLGGSNVGKTTWVTAAAQEIAGSHGNLAIVDADIGQSSIGPPAAAALSLLREGPVPGPSLGLLSCHGLSFVGSVSPLGHLLQHLVSTKKLVDRAVRAGAGAVLVDTTGLIESGAGFQLKLRKVDLLVPAHLVALQRGAELEPLLSVLADRPGLLVHRLEASPLARVRSPGERARHRADRFAAYFASSRTLTLEVRRVRILAPPAGPLGDWIGSPIVEEDRLQAGSLSGLLVGLNDASNETLGLGLWEQVSEDGRQVGVRTPVEDAAAVRILQLGSLWLDQTWQASRSRTAGSSAPPDA